MTTDSNNGRSGERPIAVRKTWLVVEETRSVAGRSDDGGPLRKVVACAIFNNPYAGQGFVTDLAALIEFSGPLGQELSGLAAEALGQPVESFGKGAIVGSAGEQEHGNAYLTGVFGDAMRTTLQGSAWVVSNTKVAGPGASLDVPLAFKDELRVRSHYDTIEIRVPDAPTPDEIVVVVAAANRGRLNARLGGLTRKEALRGRGG